MHACHARLKLNAFEQKATPEVWMLVTQVGVDGTRRFVFLNRLNIFRNAVLRSFPSSSNPVPENADNSNVYAAHDGKNHFRTKRCLPNGTIQRKVSKFR